MATLRRILKLTFRGRRGGGGTAPVANNVVDGVDNVVDGGVNVVDG